MPEHRKLTVDFESQDRPAWRAQVERDLGSAAPAALNPRVVDGTSLEPLCLRDELAEGDFVGFPGRPPFVRGRTLDAGWEICQLFGHPSPAVSAAEIEADLQGGVDSLWLHVGFDRGVRIQAVADLEILLAPVDLRSVPLHFEAPESALPIAAALDVVAKRRSVDTSELRGNLGVDPLGTLLATGRLSSGMAGAIFDLQAVARFTHERAPRLKALRVSTAAYHEAGCGPAQELGWALATATSYLRLLVESGLSVDEAAAQIGFSLSVDGEVFVQIAKLRAMRWIWSKVVAASGGATIAQAAWLHVRTSRSTKASADPWVNLPRGCGETFAAIVGGADAITTLPFDDAASLPSPMARRLARNTQLVLRDEVRLDQVVDPAGGSAYIEKLTEALARAAWDEMTMIESVGGMLVAVKSGQIHRAVRFAAARAEHRAATGQRVVVGVNQFATLQHMDMPAAASAEPYEDRRSTTSEDAMIDAQKASLLRSAAATLFGSGDRQLAGTAYFDSLCLLLERGIDLFGASLLLEHGRTTFAVEPLRRWRFAEPFEQFRRLSDRIADAEGSRPRAFLLHLDPSPQGRRRARWVRERFTTLGVEVEERDEPEGVSGLVVLCGADASYMMEAFRVVPTLRSHGARLLMLVGSPTGRVGDLRSAGVTHFLEDGVDWTEIGDAIYALWRGFL